MPFTINLRIKIYGSQIFTSLAYRGIVNYKGKLFLNFCNKKGYCSGL